jgi:hypothetical protein
MRAAVAQKGFDHLVAQISDGLLTTDEEAGLRACLPKLAELAEKMGCLEKPLSDWKPEEMMRFLVLAVRSAVPLRSVSDHDAYHRFNDDIPF